MHGQYRGGMCLLWLLRAGTPTIKHDDSYVRLPVRLWPRHAGPYAP
jgi:hypothetical protein